MSYNNPVRVALHGDFSSGKALSRDMGSLQADYYPDWKKDKDRITETLCYLDEVDLIGYSSGGSYISYLTHHLNNIRKAVLYEAPNLEPEIPDGNFPVLIIWNDESHKSKTREAQQTLLEWQVNHTVTTMTGMGRHIKFVPYPPFIGHGWDTLLNPYIRDWLHE